MKIHTCLKPLACPVKSPNEPYSNRIRRRIVRFSGVFSHSSLVILALIFSLFTINYLLLTPSVHAQSECKADSPPTDKEAIDKINKCAIEKNIFDDKLFNLNQIAGTTDSLANLLTGKSRLHPETNNITKGTGAISASGTLVASLYSNAPLSGVQYLAQKIDKLNPVPPAYAQTEGIGFNALSPVKDLWTVFRNIAYVAFVIVFVIMGFMIMFRAKISPQAVATIQDSIPRLTIALILVAFSYAIAGLFIDVMFVFLNVVISALEGAKILASPENGGGPAQKVFTDSVFGVTFSIWTDTVGSVANATKGALDSVLKDVSILDEIIEFFGGGIAAILAGIAILYVMFKVFLQLLMAYVAIILLTMFAPFFFLTQALPGVNTGSTWFKQMAANVAIFPAIALMFIFAAILGGYTGLGGSGTSGFSPEQIGQFPLLAGKLQFDDIGKLIGFGVLLMTPSVGDMVKKAITGPSQGAGMGAGAGAALGAAAGVAYTGSGAKSAVGFGRSVGQMVGQDKTEAAAARVPFTGGHIKKRREFYNQLPGENE